MAHQNLQHTWLNGLMSAVTWPQTTQMNKPVVSDVTTVGAGALWKKCGLSHYQTDDQVIKGLDEGQFHSSSPDMFNLQWAALIKISIWFSHMKMKKTLRSISSYFLNEKRRIRSYPMQGHISSVDRCNTTNSGNEQAEHIKVVWWGNIRVGRVSLSSSMAVHGTLLCSHVSMKTKIQQFCVSCWVVSCSHVMSSLLPGQRTDRRLDGIPSGVSLIPSWSHCLQAASLDLCSVAALCTTTRQRS